MHSISRFIIIFSILGFASHSTAGGPIAVQGPNGHTPVNYQNPDITVHVENGDLGNIPNSVAVTLMQQAFELWNDVNTSTIKLTVNQTQLDFDINIENYNSYLPGADNSDFNIDDNLNPIVYDSNGEIIDEILGPDQSDFVLGLGTSIFTDSGSHFIEGYTIINGKDFGFTNKELKMLFAHEIAHFFGLDHSQNNINNEESFSDFPLFCFSTDSENYPLMYPILCRDNHSLHADDISAVSALYPAANIGDSYGTLQGHFVDESGNAILGANIWAENITTGEVISIVSDYLKQGSGYYKLLLPAGTYTLHANSINSQFYDGSGVGPYTRTATDISFTDPHPIAQADYLDTTDSSEEIITVSANQTIDIDFSSIGKFVVLPEISNTGNNERSGAASYINLLLMLCLLIYGRLFACQSKP